MFFVILVSLKISFQTVGHSSSPMSGNHHHHHHLQWTVCRQKGHADARQTQAPSYQPGQKVYLSTREFKLCLLCKKLSPRYIGSFTILRQVNPVTYELQFPVQYRIHSTFHVSLLKPYHPPVSSSSTEPGPNQNIFTFSPINFYSGNQFKVFHNVLLSKYKASTIMNIIVCHISPVFYV